MPPIQWGSERLYGDGVFNTDLATAETYGHDLVTGEPRSEEEYRAGDPAGRAFLHAVDYEPSPEVTSAEYPLLLTTGRTVHQFHTRTKTGRAPELDAAAPDAWVELHPEDARAAGVREGEPVRIESPRGAIVAPARLGGVRAGVVFVPFHYGDGDRAPGEPSRAANELTVPAVDPVSEQPLFKVAAVRISPG